VSVCVITGAVQKAVPPEKRRVASSVPKSPNVISSYSYGAKLRLPAEMLTTAGEEGSAVLELSAEVICVHPVTSDVA
jgi:hypothetical protein